MDLSQDPDAMLGGMRKKTRQYIRKAEREGVATEETTDLARFHRLLRGVAERDAFGIHDLAYFAALADAFGERLHILMARIDGEDVGALLVIRMGERAWELFGGWSGTHAEQRPFYLLKWRSLMRMQQLGVRRYDMWGLAEGEELAGVENFKLGFGGEVPTWVGALETPVTGFLFPLWRFGARRRLAAASAGARQRPGRRRAGTTPRSARRADTCSSPRPGPRSERRRDGAPSSSRSARRCP